MALLSNRALARLGFASVGKHVQISDRASFYGLERLAIGNEVRIDDFCVISAGLRGIKIGEHVHIGVYSSLIGAGRITLSDFSNISSRVSVYSSNDDYSGATLTNPTIPGSFKRVHEADVFIGRHVIIGSGSVILPGVTLSEGAAVGALSLVNADCAPFGIYAGIPARRRGDRLRDLLAMEASFLAQQNL